MRPVVALGLALLVSVALVLGYRASGGGSYKPARVASPCLPRRWRPITGLGTAENEVALSALDGASCRLHTSAADLALALANPPMLQRFQAAHNISDADLAAAAQAGIVRAFADGRRSGVLDATLAEVLQAAAQAAPRGWLLDQARQLLAR